jgi:hypothetical protein
MSSMRRFSVSLVLAVLCLTSAHGQSHAVLAGKTLNLTITSGAAPFATSGTQVLVLDAPSVGRYTIDTNGTRSGAGTYTYSATSIGADLQLNTYFSTTGGAATITLYNFNASAGTGNFETFAGAVSNSGTWVFADSSGGGGGSGLPAASVVGWGWNLSGQTTIPAGLTNLIGIAAGSQFSLALKSDGTVATWGSNDTGQTTLPAGLSGVTAVAAGSMHAVALKSDGSIVQWGATANGQRTNFPTNNTGFTSISARFFHTLAVRSDGTVVSWGSDPAFGLEPVPAGLTGVTKVAAGVGFDLALKSDGTVVAWASRAITDGSVTDRDQSVVPVGLGGVVAIAAGQFHALALRSDGVVIGWGGTRAAHGFTVPANAVNGVVAIACGLEHSMVLKADGTIIAWGEGNFGQTIVPASAAGAKAIAGGEYFNLALVGQGSGGTGGTPTAPVVTAQPASQTLLTGGSTTLSVAASGTGLSYQWLLNSQSIQGATTSSYTIANATPASAGTYAVRVTNSVGSVTSSNAVITVNTPPTGAASYAGLYSGTAFASTGGGPEIVFSQFAATVSATGALTAQGIELSGTVAANGTVTFAANAFGLATGTITNQRLSASGSAPFGNTTRVIRLAGTGYTAATGVVAYAAAPANLVGYRNKVGQTFQFTLTGASTGAVWGTDVYTDDSTVARAAVHAGVVAVGETKTVTVTILGGLASYPASTRNGVTTSSWGSWVGSFSFAGATGGGATTVPTAVAGQLPLTNSIATGGRLVLPIAATGGGTFTYQWYLNSIALPGATANPYIVEFVTAANSGTYSVDVTNALGTTRLTAGTVNVGGTGSPVIALQPISKVVAPSATFTLATSASGTGLTYQWLRNGVALPGETGAILLRQNVSANDAGSYIVRVTNSAGTVTSQPATISLAADASRPANISVRTNVATGSLVIPGFVVQGTGTKRVLIRAVGPGLAAFGLTGVMADPRFAVFQGSTQLAQNDDWSAANIGTAFTATGAFALTAGSKDAALVTDLAAGRDYTVQVTNATGAGGIVLIEVYDADVLTGTSSSKLVNVSVRGQTAPGADVLTLGLVVGGRGQRTLLIRGIGPKLATFGVTGTVADPQLQIFDQQQRMILANDDWSNADFVNELMLATGYVGAFALDPGSKDAATLSLIDPGPYTIQVSGANNGTGEALVEVYEVP